MNLSIFFIPEALFYEYTNEYARVYAVMISTILSSAAWSPSIFLPPAVARTGCPPPPPWMNLAASRMSYAAL